MSDLNYTAGELILEVRAWKGQYERLRAINSELLSALEDIAAKFAKVKPGHGYYANTLAIKLMPAVQGAIAKANRTFLPPT
jgi:hypothetical protein